MVSLLISFMKRHCALAFIGLLGNVAKDEKLTEHLHILGILQSALCKLMIPFVLHNSLIFGLFLKWGN